MKRFVKCGLHIDCILTVLIFFDNQNAEWYTLDFRIDETIALPTVLIDHKQLMDQLPSVSPFSKTDMGAVQTLCPLTMDDIFSPLYGMSIMCNLSTTEILVTAHFVPQM